VHDADLKDVDFSPINSKCLHLSKNDNSYAPA